MARTFKEIPEITTPPENGIYYTMTEFSKLSGTHRNTIMKWIKAGRLKAKNPGGRNWHIDKCIYKPSNKQNKSMKAE